MPRIDSLTSLRFFAAALVVAGHAGNAPWSPFGPVTLLEPRNGVTFFYVLSGFILAYTYGAMDLRRDVRDFLVARVARIWPLHLVTLLAAVVVFTPPALAAAQPLEILKLVANALLLQAWIPSQDWYYSYNAVSWSLSVEMAFYAAFPALLFLMRKDWRLAAGLGFAALAGAFAVCYFAALPFNTPRGPNALAILYVNPLARFAEFIAGMLAYRMYAATRHRSSAAASGTLVELATVLAILVWLVATQWFAHVHARDAMPIFALWVAMTGSFPLFAVALVVFARGEGWISKALSTRPWVYLGEISYAIYMTHHLILTYVTRNLKGEAQAAPLTAYVLYWAVTLACSAALFELIEKPARRALRAAWSRRPGAGAVALVDR